MDKYEIIEMARQAGMYQDLNVSFNQSIQNFAKLVAAKEREVCAKMCETARETIWEYHEEHLKAAACNVCTNIAISIRNRSKAS